MEKTEKVVHSAPVEPSMDKPVLNSFAVRETAKKKKYKLIGIFVGVAVFGVLSGRIMASVSAGAKSQSSSGSVTLVNSSKKVETSLEAGINDEKAFPDTASGVLKAGGYEGEGTHHLDRGMGPTKDVYISSTVINLDKYLDKKVEIRGQTISGKKAGWLMDVGKIVIIQ